MADSVLQQQDLCQIGFVVRDIEQTAAAYAELFGVEKPEVRLTEGEDSTHIRYRGEPTPARAKLAFFRLGPIAIELIEPIDGPSTWREFLDEKGEGPHHIAFRVRGMNRALEKLGSRGMEAVQRGEFPGGRYAYVDATKDLKVLLELLGSD